MSKKCREDSNEYFRHIERLIALAKREGLFQLQAGDINIVIYESANPTAIGFSFPDIDPDDEPELEKKPVRKQKGRVKLGG